MQRATWRTFKTTRQKQSESKTLYWDTCEHLTGGKTSKHRRIYKQMVIEQQKLTSTPLPYKTYINHPLVHSYLNHLATQPDKKYTQRIDTAGLTKKESLDVGSKPLPNRSVCVHRSRRVFHSWFNLEKSVRHKVFKGCLDLDISKCHLTVLNIIRIRLKLEPFCWEQIKGDCLKNGFTEDQAKLLLNSAIYNAGTRGFSKALKTMLSKDRIPQSILQIREFRSYIFDNGLTLTDPFGIPTYFLFSQKYFRRKKINRLKWFSRYRVNVWSSYLYSWETYLKIFLFNDLPKSDVLLDCFDGVIIYSEHIRKNRIHLITNEIDSRCQILESIYGAKISYTTRVI